MSLQLLSPNHLHPTLFFLHLIFLYYKDHFLLLHSKIHPSLFRQNHNVLFFHSISIYHLAISFLKLLPAPHTYQQNFAEAHHWFFFLFSISCFAHYWCFHYHAGQTSSAMATTNDRSHPGTLLFVHQILCLTLINFQ